MKSVAMIGIKDSYKVWAVEFDRGSAILDWQDANPDFEVHSWAPVVALEAALGYAKGDAEGETVRSQNSRTEREEKASVAIAANEHVGTSIGRTKTFTGPASAPRSWTGSPSAGTLSKPAPTPSPTPENNNSQPELAP